MLDRTLKAIHHFVLLPRQNRLPIAHPNLFLVIALYTLSGCLQRYPHGCGAGQSYID
jgi:hypothetical protein